MKKFLAESLLEQEVTRDALRETIVTLVHRHRRYKASMIYLKMPEQALFPESGASEGRHRGLAVKGISASFPVPWAGIPPNN